MGEDPLPDLDLTVKWKTSFARRDLSFKQAGPVLPSLSEAMKKNAPKSLVRKHSLTNRNDEAKKSKQSTSTEAESTDDEDNNTEEPMNQSQSPASEIISSEIQF